MSRLTVIAIAVALIIVVLLIVLFIRAAVSLRTAAPTPTPTRTPRPAAAAAPTYTPTRRPAATAQTRAAPTAAPTSTPGPAVAAPTYTPTPRPAATAIPAASFTVDRDAVNVRAGPGTNYAILGSVRRGQSFRPTGRNPAGDWLAFDFNGQPGWIFEPLVIVTRPDLIAVAAVIPAPPPTPVPAPPAAAQPAAARPPPDPHGDFGLAVAPENRCSHYDADDYSYPQSVEPHIVARQGGRIYGPYTGTYFGSIRDTDIEHIVARSEAHDSGLCARDLQTRRNFARDLDNLTLASPSVNRHQKVDKDLAQWLPAHNRCWYVNQVIIVKRKYGLSWDSAERDAARAVLAACTSTAMVFTAGPVAPAPQPQPQQPQPGGNNALALYDDNNNGRITCAEARRHGIAPVPRGHPAYQYMRDGDGDGVVCE